MDCKHYDTRFPATCNAAAEADHDVRGKLLNAMLENGFDRQEAIDLYRISQAIRDLDRVLNAVMWTAHRKLDQVEGKPLSKAETDTISKDDKRLSLRVLEERARRIGLEKALREDLGVDEAVESIALTNEEIASAFGAFARIEATIEMSELSVGQHLEALILGNRGIADMLEDAQDLAEMRHAEITRFHVKQWKPEFQMEFAERAAPVNTMEM